jgi:hypothetical protein
VSLRPAQTLIAVIGTVMSAATYALMRSPSLRRQQFRQLGAFSQAASVLGATAMIALPLALCLAQGASGRP